MGDCVDFISFLPLEIVDIIVSKLDLETLVDCTLVCKRWNSVISTNSQVWKAACEKLDLCVKKPQHPEETVDYRTIFLRMRNRLEKMEDIYGSRCTQIFAIDPKLTCIYPCTGYCIYYHNGVLAIGNKQNSIELWKLEPHLELLLKLDTSSFSHPNCIQFDDSLLVACSSNGHWITWELPTAKVLLTQVQHPGCIILMVFNKDIDILVTCSFFSVTFWCLSSGEILLPEYHLNRYCDYAILMDVHLIPTPGQSSNNGCDYMLLCNCRSSFQVLRFNSKNISSTLNFVLLHDIDVEYCDVSIASSHVVNSSLYFICGSRDTSTSTFYKLDIFSGDIEFEIDMNGSYENLVGVGEKYALMLEWTPGLKYANNMVIFDVCTEDEFATLRIRKCPDVYSVIKMKVMLGDKRWMDGFDGFNDKGVILVNEDVNGVTNIVKWLPMIEL